MVLEAPEASQTNRSSETEEFNSSRHVPFPTYVPCWPCLRVSLLHGRFQRHARPRVCCRLRAALLRLLRRERWAQGRAQLKVESGDLAGR